MNEINNNHVSPTNANMALADAVFRPILFSTPMVQAILDGRKTQTRRKVKYLFQGWMETATNKEWWESVSNLSKIQIGDIIWVRETWQFVDFAGVDNGYVYKATDPDWQTMDEWKWNPPLFMPKEACRLFLEITDVRIERLQSISQEDAVYEGVESLWSKINGYESWNKNPFVWVYSFKVVECPDGFR